MRRLTLGISLLACVVVVCGVAAAQAPDPCADLEAKFVGNRPGCDFVDYQFAVRNTGTLYDYTVVFSGTPVLTLPGPRTCCQTVPCANEFTDEEKIVSAGGCTPATVVNLPQFPNCLPSTCDCDNDTCDENSWCATIEDPKVVVTQWKRVDDTEWTPYPEPVLLCQGVKGDPVKQSGAKGGPSSPAKWCEVQTKCQNSQLLIPCTEW